MRSMFSYAVPLFTLPVADAQSLCHFLVASGVERVVMSDADAHALAVRAEMGSTPIARLYQIILQMGLINQFALVRVTESVASIPESFTHRHLVYDLSQMRDSFPPVAAFLRDYPMMQDKILINTMPLVNSAGNYNNASSMQEVVVRAMLSRSFAVATDAWLTPRLLLRACKVYIMTTTAVLSRPLNVSSDRERDMIRMIFAFYFLYKCMNSVDYALAAIGNSARELGLRDIDMVRQFIVMIRDEIPRMTTITLQKVLEHLVPKIGVARLTTMLNYRLVMSVMRSMGESLQESQIAVEYPPYWAFMMLQAASGRKIGLLRYVRDGGAQRELKEWSDELVSEARISIRSS